MFNVLTSSEVLKTLDENFVFPNIKKEKIKIEDSLNRVLAMDVVAREDIPAFNRSTVDGYALKSSNTFGCSENLPAMLKFLGKVNMGEHSDLVVLKDSCVYVPTGGEIPAGADCCVMLEYVEDYGDEFRYIQKPGAPGQNMIYRGDDAKAGDVLVKSGCVITSEVIGTLASLGYKEVEVACILNVGIISTGDELVDVDVSPDIGQIRDVNSYSLAALVKNAGANPVNYGIVKDDKELLESVVKKAVEENDMVLISGGSSVGEKDASATIIEAICQRELLFHGISIKPGKPTICNSYQGRPIFGLPGHPLAAFFIFNRFVKYVLNKMMGKQERNIVVSATIDTTIPSNHGREEMMPVSLSGNVATPIFNKSGLISTLVKSDGYIIIDRDLEGVMKGGQVEVILY